MKDIIRFGLYPFITLLAVTGAGAMISLGYSISLSMAIPVVFSNVIIWISEFALPYQMSWRPNSKVLFIDIIHTLLSSQVVTPLVKLGLVSLLTKFSLNFLNIWPHHWPFVFQVLLAILTADLSIYLFHRWMHRNPVGWKIHEVHHSAEKLHFWASARSHPINVALVFMIEVGLLLVLGITPSVLAVWTVFMSVNGLFEHCNTDIKTGIFNRIFATAEVHRVHHSVEAKHSNTNFGNTTVIWDQIFGSYFKPEEPVKSVGIEGSTVRENYWAHLKAPFV